MNQTVNQDYNKYIPSYDVLFSNPQKLREYCLVIPVINEGERIHSLLERISELGLQNTVDIIIVDGGTTDGSLEESYLKAQHVHSLLLKTAKGKLSAQLLCAYNYAEKLGYKGIVSIDGNNKYDPATIPNFIKKLEEGYDFIQASRFISGGTAVNTPVSRDLAIRFIHAPVLSIASGFHWTDTTQGFRAYSANFLFNSKVAIYREVFSCYELLAYLSYIGPKLGFKCLEMPSKEVIQKDRYQPRLVPLKEIWNF